MSQQKPNIARVMQTNSIWGWGQHKALKDVGFLTLLPWQWRHLSSKDTLQSFEFRTKWEITFNVTIGNFGGNQTSTRHLVPCTCEKNGHFYYTEQTYLVIISLLSQLNNTVGVGSAQQPVLPPTPVTSCGKRASSHTRAFHSWLCSSSAWHGDSELGFG